MSITVKELVYKKREMEHALLCAINGIIMTFEDETDISVEGITINMVDVSTIGKPRSCILSKVRTDVRTGL